MASPLSRTVLSSFRPPITTEEDRALFQRRLALTSFVIFLLAIAFWLVSAISVAILARPHLVHIVAERSAKVQLATTASAAIVWLVVRGKRRSTAVLEALDAIISIGLCLGWTLMIIGSATHYARPELVALLASSYTLVIRAALIPSAPARTAALGVLAMAPIVPVTFAVHGPADAVMEAPLHPAVYAGIWALVGVASTTVISYVIYGLRRQVKEAMQLGQYVLEDKIGEGGMGVVYRARHAMLRRPTAIKLLSNAEQHAIDRFEREVQITAGLTHPNTVAVFDYGHTPEGVFYYAMELLEGVSIEDLVEQHGPQPIARVVHVLLQVCGALEEAHAAGLVHRDIKPANVMLTERGGAPDVAKVLDFGLVKESVDPATPAVSSANMILGTPHYMSPEAITDPSSVDGRTDLYALGAMAYYMLTSKRVFDGSSLVEVCSMHLHEPAPRPSASRPDVPAALDDLVLACLAKKPTDRPADATSFAAKLREARVAEWTREEARRWWAEHEVTSRASRASTWSTAGVLGKTVAVALDRRAKAS